MNTVSFMGMLAAFAFLIPVGIIIVCRLFNKSLLALLLYFLLMALYNLVSVGIITINNTDRILFGLITNYLDAPLLLIALHTFYNKPVQKKALRISLAVFLCYEAFITIIYGFNAESIVYILGPGICMLFAYSLYFFSQYVKFSVEKNKVFGKTLMIASILFAYGCYGMVYCFYYLKTTSAIQDVFLIYYIASLLATALMSIGLVLYSKRFKQVKEAEIIRKELQVFYNSK